MAQIALNAGGGTAVRVQARVPDPDVARLAVLAARLGIRQPVLIRRVLAAGLDRLERETDPLDTGG